eukprot:883750-Rhodomonas_salina.1
MGERCAGRGLVRFLPPSIVRRVLPSFHPRAFPSPRAGKTEPALRSNLNNWNTSSQSRITQISDWCGGSENPGFEAALSVQLALRQSYLKPPTHSRHQDLCAGQDRLMCHLRSSWSASACQ